MLEEVKQEYLSKLKNSLTSLKKSPFGSGLAGLSSLHKNMMIVNKNVKEIAEKINNQFVNAINRDNIACKFSDDERMTCYQEFRKESTQIVSDFNQNFLKKF
ncbi:hypothetical protein ACFQ3R_00445 [Mesonia ostreae]|uniref:Uncharacterized protein n=1 Tax=Mesonia ostreae TaxID=861110 RepID=A0ABU2KJJ4_9FLAO|nr:hypothetical protein [Mesonia ostreae]MDT0294839.1 hypothetical protein [Mesonia ostreae]